MTTYIYSYNPHSASAKALAEGLGVKRIKHHNSKYKPKPDDVIINWGSSNLPDNLDDAFAINDSTTIGKVTNKLSFFEMIDSELTVPWTKSTGDAEEWAFEGKTIVVRHKLTGHSGDGIEIIEGNTDKIPDVPQAPLYTLYTPKKDEYRIHCYRHLDDAEPDNPNLVVSVFDVQRKARKLDVPNEEVDWRVRNLNGGFIYQRQDIDVPAAVTDVALKVFQQTSLDFGAVDIIYNDKQKKAYALEVNTAPGLTGTTLEKYVEMFKELL